MDPTRSCDLPNCSAIDLAEIRRSSKINSWIWSIFSAVVGLRTNQHPGTHCDVKRATCFWCKNVGYISTCRKRNKARPSRSDFTSVGTSSYTSSNADIAVRYCVSVSPSRILHRRSSIGSTWNQHGRQPQHWRHKEIKLLVEVPSPILVLLPPPPLSSLLCWLPVVTIMAQSEILI